MCEAIGWRDPEHVIPSNDIIKLYVVRIEALRNATRDKLLSLDRLI